MATTVLSLQSLHDMQLILKPESIGISLSTPGIQHFPKNLGDQNGWYLGQLFLERWYLAAWRCANCCQPIKMWCQNQSCSDWRSGHTWKALYDWRDMSFSRHQKRSESRTFLAFGNWTTASVSMALNWGDKTNSLHVIIDADELGRV